MQRANAGRCACTEQRCVTGSMDRASLAEVSTGLDNPGGDPYSHLHMTATAPRFSFYYGYYS